MKYLTLELIKSHVRIDGNYEDALLQLYGETAEETVMIYLNRGKTVDDAYNSLVAEYGSLPSAIKQATLMLVDVSYQYRSPVSPNNMSSVPYTFEILVKPYMKLSGYGESPSNT